jgi:hypothetical protein
METALILTTFRRRWLVLQRYVLACDLKERIEAPEDKEIKGLFVIRR